MSDIANLLTSALGNSQMSTLSQQLGAQPQQANQAIAAALPMLMGALSKNASSPQQAENLNRVLERDRHDQLLDNVSGFLGGSMGSNKAAAGEAILGHLLGGKRGQVEQAVGQASGLDMAQASKLLATLAPLVMGALSKQKQQNNMGAGGISDLLSSERNRLDSSGLGGMLGPLLDGDGDGDFDGNDIAKKGMEMLGGFLSGR